MNSWCIPRAPALDFLSSGTLTRIDTQISHFISSTYLHELENAALSMIQRPKPHLLHIQLCSHMRH